MKTFNIPLIQSLRRHSRVLVVLITLLGCLSSTGQDLSLFGDFETKVGEVTASQDNTREVRVSGNGPAFRLLGTSRIGGNSRIHLLARGGEVLSVSITDENNVPIPDHAGYSIVGIQNRRVEVQYPNGVACEEFPDLGVVCQPNSNRASISLVVADAIVPTQESLQSTSDAETREAPDNPFARIRAANAADNPAAEPNSQRFRPRRIPPEDVPEGMRVISTPFGDRLVQE